MDESKNTEEIIFEAARDVFYKKGFDGARMQDIADKAEINKSMLHYYYRSKDKLFEEVYQQSIRRIIPQLMEYVSSDEPVNVKLPVFASRYMRLLKENPHIPTFIIHELNNNPERIQNFVLNQVGSEFRSLIEQMDKELSNRKNKNLKSDQLLINILALTIFPFIAKPIIQILFNFSESEFEKFLDDRENVLPAYVNDILIHQVKR